MTDRRNNLGADRRPPHPASTLETAERLARRAWAERCTDPVGVAPLADEALELTHGLDLTSFHTARVRALALIAVSTAARRSGLIERAIQTGDEALSLLAALDAPLLRARALLSLSEARTASGELTRALVDAKAGLAQLRGREGEPGRLAADLTHSLGCIEFARTDFLAARSQFARARRLAQAARHTLLEALTDISIGSVLSELRDDEGAVEAYTRAVALQHRLGDTVGVRTALFHRAELYRRRGDFAEALRGLTEMQELGAPTSDAALALRAELLRGILHASQGETRRGLTIITALLARPLVVDNPTMRAECLAALGAAHEEHGDDAAARTAYDRARQLVEGLEAPLTDWRCRMGLASIATRAGDHPKAVEQLEELLEKAERGSSHEIALLCRQHLSEAHEQLGNLGRALEVQKQLRQAERQLFDDRVQARLQSLQDSFDFERTRHREEQLKETVSRLEDELATTRNELRTVSIELEDETERRILLEESQDLLPHPRWAPHRTLLPDGIAHGFNNLLTVIHGYADDLLRRSVHDDDSRDNAREIIVAADRASVLIGQLLDERMPADDPSSVTDRHQIFADLALVIGRVIGRKVQLPLDLGEDGEIDSESIERGLLALATTLQGAMSAGSYITLPAANQLAARPLPASVAETTHDTGFGVHEAAGALLVDPFSVSEPQYTADDLLPAAAPSYLAPIEHPRHRPARPATARPSFDPSLSKLPTAASANLPAAARRLTVLIAEDDPCVRDLLRRALLADGCHVLEAADGERALELARQHADDIDVVVSDIVMPGMSGLDLLDELKRLENSPPLVLTSGHPDLRAEGVASNKTLEFLPKPFRIEELKARIERLVQPVES